MKIKLIVSFFLLLSFTILTQAQDKDDGVEVGKASFYGKKLHKRKTASGVLYDKDAYTCAHPTYPFGTKLLVRNPLNDEEVVVEVNDRGPHTKNRIIDLSYIAAQDLGIIRHGIAHVEVSEYIEPDTLSIVSDSIILLDTSISSLVQ